MWWIIVLVLVIFPFPYTVLRTPQSGWDLGLDIMATFLICWGGAIGTIIGHFVR